MSEYYLEDALSEIVESCLDSYTKHELFDFILEGDIEAAYGLVQGVLSDMFTLEKILEYSRKEPQWEDYFNIDLRDF